MILPLAILAVLTIAGAAAALILRNLVHCVLALTVCFIGLAGLYLQLGAQFIGLAQVLVYVGAVSILVVFAILLTRTADSPTQSLVSPFWITGALVAVAVFAVRAWIIASSPTAHPAISDRPDVTVKQIGDSLMSRFALPLEVIGLLLTAAMLGAVTIALRERQESKFEESKFLEPK
jgi:NADH-quinone oxidoreductase subunit J